MANTVTKQKINDGPRNTVLHVMIVGDGSGEETATVIVDASDLSSTPTDLVLVGCHASLVGFTAKLSWDATANVDFLALGEGETDFNYTALGSHDGGGLINNAGAGKTGDVLITTTGLGNGDYGHVTLHLRKRNRNE